MLELESTGKVSASQSELFKFKKIQEYPKKKLFELQMSSPDREIFLHIQIL